MQLTLWAMLKMPPLVIDMTCEIPQGTPILQRISNECNYEFEWPTNVMCPVHTGQFDGKKCELHNSQINHSINLQSIFKGGLVTVRSTDSWMLAQIMIVRSVFRSSTKASRWKSTCATIAKKSKSTMRRAPWNCSLTRAAHADKMVRETLALLQFLLYHLNWRGHSLCVMTGYVNKRCW